MERPEDRVALIEWLGRDGQVLRSADVAAWPLSLGRALDNTVVLDDPHVAAHHARLAPDASGQLQLQALPSHNGLLLDGKPCAGAAESSSAATTPITAASALLQLGTTRLRLRQAGSASAALAPEQPLPAAATAVADARNAAATGPRAPVLTGLAVLVLAAASHWVKLDPGADYTDWLPLVLGLPTALVAWCGLWALLSKLFQHRFDFSGHLRCALPWLLALWLQSLLWPALTAALALPVLWKLGSLLQLWLTLLLLHAHLRHMLPQHGRTLATAMAVLALTGTALDAALNWRSHDSLLAAPYMSTLPLPALRLAGTAPSAALVQDMAPLAAQLAARVAQARKDDDDGEGDADAQSSTGSGTRVQPQR